MSIYPRVPRVVVLGGPNGAGKTTSANLLLPDNLAIRQFVNADVIAQGLSGFAPETTALQAGRIMLARLDELARLREDFAFETTLASRSFAPFLRRLRGEGYQVTVLYVWLPSADIAIRRVAARVRRGGHHVPDDDVRRRYQRGLENFFRLYQPIADAWMLCDNSGRRPRIVARGDRTGVTSLADEETYDAVKRAAGVARE